MSDKTSTSRKGLEMAGWEALAEKDEIRAAALDVARELTGEYRLDMLSTRIMQVVERAYLAGMQAGIAQAKRIYSDA